MDPRVILTFLIMLLELFWIWMFWDMTTNDRLPNSSDPPLTWPPSSKNNWMFAFIFLNVFAAVYYYWAEYRNK